MSDLSPIDVENKTIHLVGEVNEDMYLMLQRAIGKLHNDPREYCITINSQGGNLIDGLAIYDLIKSYCPESKIIVYGSCMSAASVILQAGKTRIASPSSEVMIHYGHDEAENGEEKKFNTRLGLKMRDILLTRAKVKKSVMTRWVNSTKHFDANDALKYGLIDLILKDDENEG